MSWKFISTKQAVEAYKNWKKDITEIIAKGDNGRISQSDQKIVAAGLEKSLDISRKEVRRDFSLHAGLTEEISHERMLELEKLAH